MSSKPAPATPTCISAPTTAHASAEAVTTSHASTPVHTPTRRLRQRTPSATAPRETRSLRRVDELVASGQTEKAISQLRKLIRDVPHSSRGCLRIAALLRETHRVLEAQQVLRAAVEAAPQSLELRETLAELSLEIGQWEEAIVHSKALLRLYPRSLFARDVLAAAYLQRGLIDQALRVTDEMVLLEPSDASNYFKRGVLLQQKGHIGGAMQAFLRVLQMEPEGDAAEESRAAVEMLDNYQIRQVVMLAVEDIPFRLALHHDCAQAVQSRGYLISERGISALSQMRFDDLPAAPPRMASLPLPLSTTPPDITINTSTASRNTIGVPHTLLCPAYA